MSATATIVRFSSCAATCPTLVKGERPGQVTRCTHGDLWVTKVNTLAPDTVTWVRLSRLRNPIQYVRAMSVLVDELAAA